MVCFKGNGVLREEGVVKEAANKWLLQVPSLRTRAYNGSVFPSGRSSQPLEMQKAPDTRDSEAAFIDSPFKRRKTKDEKVENTEWKCLLCAT